MTITYGIGKIELKQICNLTERASLLKEMLSIVNEERKGTKYKSMSPKLFAIKLSHIPTQDLYYTHSVSKDYKNRKGSYSKFLFGSIKIQQNEK